MTTFTRPRARGLVRALPFIALGAATAAHAEAQYDLSGNIQYDVVRFSDDGGAYADGSDWRRARIALSGKDKGKWEWVAEFDFAANAWVDAFARVHLGRGWSVRAGNFKPPMFMDELTSSKRIVFMERSMSTNAFGAGRRVGVSADWVGAASTVSLAVFDQSVDGKNEGAGLAARATHALGESDGHLFHFGGSVGVDSPETDTARWRARPEARVTDLRLVDTGTLDHVEQQQRFNLEGAWAHGRWLVQAEAHVARITRDGVADVDASGGYVAASTFLTGEQRPYDKGLFGNPEPQRDWGALEAALRLSTLDLDDASVQGGEQTNLTAGLNWYANAETRVMLNYIKVDSERRAVERDPSLLELRLQVVF